MARYFPERALQANQSGAATLHCVVDGRGSLQGCIVVEQSPAQAGFGAAALQISRLFKVAPVGGDGQSNQGRTVTLPIKFRPPGA